MPAARSSRSSIHPGPAPICALKGITPLGPSVNTNANGAVSRPITIDEIHKVVKQYGQAARRAAKGAAADGGHEAYNVGAKPVEPLARGKADARDGKGTRAQHLDDCEKCLFHAR